MFECGVILGLLLMLSSAWLTDLASRLLVKTAFLSKKRSYEYLGKIRFCPYLLLSTLNH